MALTSIDEQQYGGYNNQSGYGQSNNRYDAPAGNPYQQPSGNPYQQSGNPYGQTQSSNYGQTQYGQTEASPPYGQTQSSNPYAAPPGNPYNDEEQGIPMTNYNGGAAAYGQQKRQDPRAILNETQELNKEIDRMERDLVDLRRLQGQALDDPDASQNTQTNRQLDKMNSDFMGMYQNFVGRLTKIKQTPGAGESTNSGHIRITQNKLKQAMERYQQADVSYQQKLREQMARQYRIVRPDASESEVREATDDTTATQVFSQALLQSDRRGQSQSALRAVQGRHEAIQKIERQMAELATLFQQMAVEVEVQENTVTQINQQAEVVQDNVVQANTHLDGAVVKARAARRKKWICLGIAILILIIIVIVVAVAVTVTRKTATP